MCGHWSLFLGGQILTSTSPRASKDLPRPRACSARWPDPDQFIHTNPAPHNFSHCPIRKFKNGGLKSNVLLPRLLLSFLQRGLQQWNAAGESGRSAAGAGRPLCGAAADSGRRPGSFGYAPSHALHEHSHAHTLVLAPSAYRTREPILALT